MSGPRRAALGAAGFAVAFVAMCGLTSAPIAGAGGVTLAGMPPASARSLLAPGNAPPGTIDGTAPSENGPDESIVVPAADPGVVNTTVPKSSGEGSSVIPPVLPDLQDSSAPLVVVPAGCVAPEVPTAVFIGELGKRDFRTAQFTIRSLRAGSVARWSAGDQVQVRYGDDVRFLQVGDTYVIGAQADPATGQLTSQVREATALFGGDAVLGVDDKDVACPTLEDPVMTLSAMALPIDIGLLTPLSGAKPDLLLAILRPVVIAFLVLLGIVMAKQLLFASGRSLRAVTVTERERPTRIRVRRPRRLRTSRRAPLPPASPGSSPVDGSGSDRRGERAT